MRSLSVAFFLVLGLLALSACNNDLEVLAPEQTQVAVFGVLKPQQPVQYIRLARVFRTEEDANELAATQDFSLAEATVTLTNLGSGDAITLQPYDSLRSGEGDFGAPLTLYRTSEPILPNARYRLEVRLPGDTTVISAETDVPAQPYTYRPDSSTGGNTIGEARAYPLFDFTSPNTTVEFFTRSLTAPDPILNGYAFEIRVDFRYGEVRGPGDTLWQETRFGPTSPFTESNFACSGSNAARCYRVGRQVLQFWDAELPPNRASVVYRAANLSQSTRIEVTAMSEPLYRYIATANPDFVDFTTLRADYTNVTNGVGVLGALQTDERWVRLADTVRTELGIRGI